MLFKENWRACSNFISQSWNDDVAFMFSVLLQSWKKSRTKQKKPTLSAPSFQAWWRHVFINSVFPCPLVKWHGIQHKAVISPVARTTGGQPILLTLYISQNWRLKSLWRKEPRLGTLQFPIASAMMNLFLKHHHNCCFKSCFSLYFINSCCMPWPTSEGSVKDTEKWGWICYGEACI